MTLNFTHTLSMEVQAISDHISTELGSFRSWIEQPVSLNGTSSSQQHASDATSTTTTTHSEIDYHGPVITALGDRQAIQHLPTNEHHSLPHVSLYQYLLNYPTEIQHDDLHSTSPESLGQTTNRNTPQQQLTINGSLQSQPQTRQDCHNHPSFSTTRNNTTDQNASQYLQSLSMSPHSTPTPPSKQSTAGSSTSEEPQSSPQLQGWLRVRSTEELMRIGHHRWEDEEEGHVSLNRQIFDQNLE